MMSVFTKICRLTEFCPQRRRASQHATTLCLLHQPIFSPLDITNKASHQTIHHGCTRAIRELERVRDERGKCTSPAVTNRWRRVGVFSTLTNAYAIVAVGASENFYRYANPCAQALLVPKPFALHVKTNTTRTVFSRLNFRMLSPSATPRSPEHVLSAV
jgi:hypothetical protein